MLPTASATQRVSSNNHPAAGKPDGQAFRDSVIQHLINTCGRDPKVATPSDLYNAVSYSVRDRLVQRWLATQRTYIERDAKVVCYLSAEFLTGRSLGLCLMNIDLYEAAKQLAAEYGYEIGALLEQEGDPGLGNGGLGRLAACFMDALATLELPAFGYGIRYDFGMFEQSIEDGWQVEHHDNWLRLGNVWELARHDEVQRVRLYGRVEYLTDDEGRMKARWVDTRSVVGVPHDSFIVGHRTNNVNTLRLWAARATREFDLRFFNSGDYRRAVEEKIDIENISKVLYPNDQSDEGKELRLKQQYFFVACSIADIVRRYKLRHTTFTEFPNKVAIQLNDTHPAIGVAELMRVLVDENDLEWDEAWAITEKTIGYTNHTLLPEALERWSVSLFERLLPRHLHIIYEINRRFLRQVQTRWPMDDARLRRMSIIEEGAHKQVRMAHLATVGGHSINGVAKLHSDLVKSQLLHDFYELWPERFNNKTNGVTPRRWMLNANPKLTALISKHLGARWIDRDLTELKRLLTLVDDEAFLEELRQVKQHNKKRVVELVKQRTGKRLPVDAMFVVHIKRIHEYKRQLLLCLHIIGHYLKLKQNPGNHELSRCFIFAGKAAPGYAMAKLHIKLLNDVADIIASDPDMDGKLAMVFVPNYGVSLAEVLIPAADLSVQISTAGTEASGTSNMKFTLNGAMTIGTLDGANIEIRDAVGAENFFLFGMHTEEVAALRASGYRPSEFIAKSRILQEAIALIESGFFSAGDPDRFKPIVDSLKYHDPFMVCADFEAFRAAEADAAQAYADTKRWSKMAAHNIALSYPFSADNTVKQYADEIWHVRPESTDMAYLPGK